MSNRSCRHETLARNSVAHIQRCEDCESLSVHLGPVTVRSTEASFEALWAAVNEAAALQASREGYPTSHQRGVA